MTRWITILILSLFVSLGYAQRKETKVHFGFSFMPSHSGWITYGLVYTKDSVVQQVVPINEEDFIKGASGWLESPANPERENLFVENEVPNCWILLDSVYLHYGEEKYVGYECLPLTHLWRIRYKEHPTERNLGSGWARSRFRPDDTQMLFLELNYGLESLSDYIYGENLWKLLREMQEPGWWQAYKNAGANEEDEEGENESEGQDPNEGEEENEEKEE